MAYPRSEPQHPRQSDLRTKDLQAIGLALVDVIILAGRRGM